MSVSHAAFNIAKGFTRQLDVAKCEYGDGQTRFSFLELIWGLAADVDIESEPCRCCGPLRFDLFAVMRMCSLRRYPGELSYLGATDTEPPHYWSIPSSSSSTSPSSSLLPSLQQQVPSSWERVDDGFITVWAMNVTHASAKGD